MSALWACLTFLLVSQGIFLLSGHSPDFVPPSPPEEPVRALDSNTTSNSTEVDEGSLTGSFCAIPGVSSVCGFFGTVTDAVKSVVYAIQWGWAALQWLFALLTYDVIGMPSLLRTALVVPTVACVFLTLVSIIRGGGGSSA